MNSYHYFWSQFTTREVPQEDESVVDTATVVAVLQAMYQDFQVHCPITIMHV